ncbi:MAG: AAA family ATPase [Planctomycetota bacterium]|jgi:predicted ATP-dependent endonuclease of OLD family
MKLKSAHITKFRSITDSTEFSIDEGVTCLVGKNESGKTAILHALEKINSIDPNRSEFRDLDYPRSQLTEFRNHEEDDENIVAVHTVWALEQDDVDAVEAVVGEGVLTATEITVERGYYSSTTWNFSRDENQGFINLVESSGLHAEEKEAMLAAGSIRAAAELIAAKKEAPDDNGGEVQSPREKQLLQTIKTHYGSQRDCWRAVVNVLKRRLPKMVYFGSYMRMPGQISIDDLNNRPEAKDEEPNKVFLALLGLINRTAEDLQEIGEFELMQAELEAASNKLTREIFKYWTQNKHLKVQFRFEQGLPNDPAPFNSGYVMRTRIENQRYGVTTSFDDRSTGFVWFFSFLVWFSQVRKNYGKNLVLLMDEPGLSLHAKAQADLLRYIEDRLSDFQVIYTTHSPFMIDSSNLLRVRTVEDIFVESDDPLEDDRDLGTVVGDQVLSTDSDTIFPLQAALGYDISQSLFIGEHTLLVEGPSELLYLPWFSRRLKEAGRTALDPRWTLTPCGGIDKVPSFLALFAGQKLHIATLVDFAEGGKKRVRDLRSSELLQSGHVLTPESFCGQSEADTEDLLGRAAYINLVNDCYGLKGKERLPAAKAKDAPERVVKEVEEHFRTKATSCEDFDHFRPSEYLNQKKLDYALKDIDVALNRFEEVFKALNALL